MVENSRVMCGSRWDPGSMSYTSPLNITQTFPYKLGSIILILQRNRDSGS